MKIKVFTFNMRTDVKSDGINCFDGRKERIEQTIRDYSPDIIGFQEIKPHMKAWLRDNFQEYTLIGCGRGKDLMDESCPVAFKKDAFELISSECFWLSATPSVPGTRYGEDQSPCPRITTALLLKHRECEKPFLFVNTHLDHKGSVARLLGSVQLLQYISEKNMPFVLTGDFNAMPESREIKVITDNSVLGIKDLTENIGGTFHNFGKIAPADRHKIDYIFTNMEGDPANAFAIEDEGVNGVYISDHFPLCAFVDCD